MDEGWLPRILYFIVRQKRDIDKLLRVQVVFLPFSLTPSPRDSLWRSPNTRPAVNFYFATDTFGNNKIF